MTKEKKKFNSDNARIKKQYCTHLKEADGKADSTIREIKKAIHRFEEFTNFANFKNFSKLQATNFKKEFAKSKSLKTGDNISKSTLLSTINNLKEFFKWLSYQQGYRKICLTDIKYFNLSDKDKRAATSPKPKEYPSLEQVRKLFPSMPENTELEKRNKAILAFLILTGVRVSALISLKIKHYIADKELIFQDPKEVNTKKSKAINTYLVNIDDEIKEYFLNWIKFLKEEKLFSDNSPLFPARLKKIDEQGNIINDKISDNHLQSTGVIDDMLKAAFQNADLKYYSPHSFRNLLVSLASKFCTTPEEFKAYSQNLGHESPLTTFVSYGYVNEYRQGEIIKGLNLSSGNKSQNDETKDILGKILEKVSQ